VKFSVLAILLCTLATQAADNGNSPSDDCERGELYRAKQSSAVTWENDALSAGRVKTDDAWFAKRSRGSLTSETSFKV
jgi:hypothetical protein